MEITSTFDKSDEILPLQPTSDENISPLSSLLGQKTEAIRFTYQLFLSRPDLFGLNAETIFYAQYAGHKFKPATYYNIFELFITQTNTNYVLAKRTNQLNSNNPYTFDSDYIITWARVIQHNQLILEFEPIMARIKTALNDWLAHPIVIYNGIQYPITFFKPLCYTFSGENYITLIPYIAYLFTFFIYCYPYEFDEGQTESSTFGFYKSIDDWYMKHYTQLAQDLDIDIVRGDLQTLSTVTDQQWKDLLNHMLNADQIIRLRNDEIGKTPALDQQCISDQNSVPNGQIYSAFQEVINQLIKIAIHNSPIKKFFDKIPTFNSKYVDINELMMLTQYCLAGGDSKFALEPEIDALNDVPGKLPNYSYAYCADQTNIQKYPSGIIDQNQHVTSKIPDLKICIHKPFCAADLILEMATSYLKNAFEIKRTDILDDNPIEIDESMLRDRLFADSDIVSLLNSLFVNGVWMYDNTPLSQALNILISFKSFQEEISDILNLSAVTQVVYTNRQASIIIEPLILSYINVWLLAHCELNYPLRAFSPISYLISTDKPSPHRIKKLIDMLSSLMYISNPMYCRFVEVTMNEFTQLMLNNPIIQQPYVKGLDDYADLYAIGGCETYNYSHYSNPLIRGYGFVSTVFGNCEALETFYKWIYNLSNTALFEFIEQSLNAIVNIETSLKSQYVQMMNAKKYPHILNNYSFKTENYIFKTTPYFLELRTSDGNYIISLICKYAFGYSNPRRSIERQIVFREITFKRNVLTAYSPVVNGLRVNSFNSFVAATVSTGGTPERLPVYDYNGVMEDVSIIYSAPKGRKTIKLVLFNSRFNQNNTIWIFTAIDKPTRFQRYETMANDRPKQSQPKPAQEMYPERANPPRNRVMKDYLNQRTLNQVSFN